VLIRSFRHDEAQKWADLRARLWPSADPVQLVTETQAFLNGDTLPTVTVAFFAEENHTPLGFIELSVRPFSDGCDSMPVPHVEAWYVEEFARGRGIGRALVAAGEAWARERGFVELASDTEPWNAVSLAAHERCGFQEVELLVKFRKALN
jgi:aminoglycoside 6'-N-acetyltransferase I